MRKHQLTVRATKSLRRACSWLSVLNVRQQLQVLPVRFVTLFPGGELPRLACWSPLHAILDHQVGLAKLQGTLVRAHTKPVRVIVCPDATLLWRAAVTRIDVHVACHSDPSVATKPSSWTAWVTMDGADCLANIRAVDAAAGLGRQVLDLQAGAIVEDATGGAGLCSVFLTGDGKVMQMTNARPGSKCWLCDLPEPAWAQALTPSGDLPMRARDGTG